MNISVVEADVLVIGGGQAALRAAIEARRQGAKVVMASKGRIGAGGSSAISDSVHSAILLSGDSPEIFCEDILKGGKQINQPELARALADDCTERVQELQREFKVELHLDRELITPGHSFPRRCYHRGGVGIAIVRQLREYAVEMGIQFYEKTSIVDLLTDTGYALGDGSPDSESTEGRIIGAVGTSDNECVIFSAGGTILAAGGLGRIYAHSDNPIDIIGEAVGIAWRHGAELRDMEFIQFYPYRLVSPINIDLYTKLFGKGAVMRNWQGSRFLEEYPRKELETRDVVCYQMFKQGKVLLDLSEVTASDLQAITPRLHSLLTKGYQGELLMQPVEHYSIGGISIDADGRTTLKGLYACGECTGGVHGANRLGGGALTESLVFGARAGFAAAQELSKPATRMIANAERAVMNSGATNFMPVSGINERVADVRKRVQEIMWNKVGIERTESGLQHACDELGQMAEEVRDYTPLFNMLQVAQIVARTALARKESRGAHQMIDYPRERDEWHGNLVVRGETVTFRPHPFFQPSGGN